VTVIFLLQTDGINIGKILTRQRLNAVLRPAALTLFREFHQQRPSTPENQGLILALSGGALGVAFASMANRLLLHMISGGPETIPLDVSIDLRLLTFTFAVTVATAILFGTIPAIRATNIQLTHDLKDGRGPQAAGARNPKVASWLLLTVSME
jgi:hypothetical protein